MRNAFGPDRGALVGADPVEQNEVRPDQHHVPALHFARVTERVVDHIGQELEDPFVGLVRGEARIEASGREHHVDVPAKHEQDRISRGEVAQADQRSDVVAVVADIYAPGEQQIAREQQVAIGIVEAYPVAMRPRRRDDFYYPIAEIDHARRAGPCSSKTVMRFHRRDRRRHDSGAGATDELLQSLVLRDILT